MIWCCTELTAKLNMVRSCRGGTCSWMWAALKWSDVVKNSLQSEVWLDHAEVVRGIHNEMSCYGNSVLPVNLLETSTYRLLWLLLCWSCGHASQRQRIIALAKYSVIHKMYAVSCDQSLVTCAARETTHVVSFVSYLHHHLSCRDQLWTRCTCAAWTIQSMKENRKQ